MKKSNKIGNEIKFLLNNSQGKDKALHQKLEAEFQKKEDNLLVLEVSTVAKNFFECKLI